MCVLDARFVAGVASCIADSRCTKMVWQRAHSMLQKITHGSCCRDLRAGRLCTYGPDLKGSTENTEESDLCEI